MGPRARAALVLLVLAGALSGFADAFQICPPGQYWWQVSGGAACLDCPGDNFYDAYYCPGGTDDYYPCDNTRGQPTSNGTHCIGYRDCYPRYYLASDAKDCLVCPENSYCQGWGTYPVACPRGTSSPPGMPMCFTNNCKAGLYHDADRGRCLRCPKGLTSVPSTYNCTVTCPANHVCAPTLPMASPTPCWTFDSRRTLSPAGSGSSWYCQQGPDCSTSSTSCHCAMNKLSLFPEATEFSVPSTPLAPPTKWCNCTRESYSTGLAALDLPLKGKYPACPASGASDKPCAVGAGTMRTACCRTCREMNANAPLGSPLPCASWVHWVPPQGSADDVCGSRAFPVSEEDCGRCIIYPEGTAPPKATVQGCPLPEGPATDKFRHAMGQWVSMGKGCPGGKNDPHFVGARGTRFGFNGAPGQSFCLVTDPRFQVNMRMHGFYDTNTYGASILRDGKAVRTWIKELAVLWVRPAGSDAGDASPAVHSFRMVARDGKSMERGGGFVGALELDGQPVPRMRVGGAVSGEGGVKLTFLGYEKDGRGFFDVDAYALEIRGLLSAELRVRVAHPLLQTPRDAMAHINALFLDVEASAATHGILGQTFRPGAARDQRARKFSALARVLGHEVAADGASGEGFLDGAVEDYRTSCPLCADCKFSAFNGREAQE